MRPTLVAPCEEKHGLARPEDRSAADLGTRRRRAVRPAVPSEPCRVGIRKWRASQVRLLCPRLHSLAESGAMKNRICLPRNMNLARQGRDRLIRRVPQLPREVRPRGNRRRCKVAARTAGPAILLTALRAQTLLGIAQGRNGPRMYLGIVPWISTFVLSGLPAA